MSAAWNEGYQARFDGEDEAANPYPAGSVLHLQWLGGYVAAEVEFV